MRGDSPARGTRAPVCAQTLRQHKHAVIALQVAFEATLVAAFRSAALRRRHCNLRRATDACGQRLRRHQDRAAPISAARRPKSSTLAGLPRACSTEILAFPVRGRMVRAPVLADAHVQPRCRRLAKRQRPAAQARRKMVRKGRGATGACRGKCEWRRIAPRRPAFSTRCRLVGGGAAETVVPVQRQAGVRAVKPAPGAVPASRFGRLRSSPLADAGRRKITARQAGGDKIFRGGKLSQRNAAVASSTLRAPLLRAILLHILLQVLTAAPSRV